MNPNGERNEQSRWITGALVVGGPLIVVASVLAKCVAGKNSGSLAEWIAGLATLAAFVGAAWAARYAKEAAEHARSSVLIERGRDERREIDARRAQADLVAAWVPTRVQWIGGLVTTAISAAQEQSTTREPVSIVPESMVVAYRNAGNLPIPWFSLDLYARSPESGASWTYVASHLVGVLPPESTGSAEIADSAMGASFREAMNQYPSTHEQPADLALGWSLRDMTGVRWRNAPDAGVTSEVEANTDLKIVSTRSGDR